MHCEPRGVVRGASWGPGGRKREIWKRSRYLVMKYNTSPASSINTHARRASIAVLSRLHGASKETYCMCLTSKKKWNVILSLYLNMRRLKKMCYYGLQASPQHYTNLHQWYPGRALFRHTCGVQRRSLQSHDNNNDCTTLATVESEHKHKNVSLSVDIRTGLISFNIHRG